MYAQHSYESMLAFIERDLRAQARWLAHRAKIRGYVDLKDVLDRAPAVYIELGATRRQAHPLPQWRIDKASR